MKAEQQHPDLEEVLKEGWKIAFRRMLEFKIYKRTKVVLLADDLETVIERDPAELLVEFDQEHPEIKEREEAIIANRK